MVLAALEHSNFCYSLKFVIISSVHDGATSLTINVNEKNIKAKKFLLRMLSKF